MKPAAPFLLVAIGLVLLLTGVLNAVETAPTASDNQSVILWVVGILVVVVGFLFKRLFDKTDAGEAMCRKENADLKAEIQKIREDDHKEQREAHAKAIAAVQSMADAVSGLKDAIVQAGSGAFKTRDG